MIIVKKSEQGKDTRRRKTSVKKRNWYDEM